MEHGRQRSNWSITDTSASDMSARKMSVRFNSLNDKSDFKETIGFTHEKPVYQRHLCLRYVRSPNVASTSGRSGLCNQCDFEPKEYKQIDSSHEKMPVR